MSGLPRFFERVTAVSQSRSHSPRAPAHRHRSSEYALAINSIIINRSSRSVLNFSFFWIESGCWLKGVFRGEFAMMLKVSLCCDFVKKGIINEGQDFFCLKTFTKLFYETVKGT